MSEVRLTTSSTQRNQAWLSQLRTACLMVSGNSASLIHATTLSRRFPGLEPVEGRELALTASHLAHEYGLIAELELEAETICVRLSRREPGLDTPSGPGAALDEPVGVASAPPESNPSSLALSEAEVLR